MEFLFVIGAMGMVILAILATCEWVVVHVFGRKPKIPSHQKSQLTFDGVTRYGPQGSLYCPPNALGSEESWDLYDNPCRLVHINRTYTPVAHPRGGVFLINNAEKFRGQLRRSGAIDLYRNMGVQRVLYDGTTYGDIKPFAERIITDQEMFGDSETALLFR